MMFVLIRMHGAPEDEHGAVRVERTRQGLAPGEAPLLESVTALPDGKQLSTSSENTVTATTDLAFRVAVQDSGSFQEFDVKVTLTIAKTGAPIVKSKTIAIINAGETKTLVFSDLGAPPFGVPTTVKVDVQPVPGEKTLTNNSAEYRVIFSLG